MVWSKLYIKTVLLIGTFLNSFDVIFEIEVLFDLYETFELTLKMYIERSK